MSEKGRLFYSIPVTTRPGAKSVCHAARRHVIDHYKEVCAHDSTTQLIPKRRVGVLFVNYIQVRVFVLLHVAELVRMFGRVWKALWASLRYP